MTNEGGPRFYAHNENRWIDSAAEWDFAKAPDSLPPMKMHWPSPAMTLTVRAAAVVFDSDSAW
jgi:hypothetical protein